MGKKEKITDNKFYSILRNMGYFLSSNLIFLAAISPLIIYGIIFREKSSVRIVLALSIFVGPAISTLCSVMSRFIRHEQTSAIKDFIHFYKYNWFHGFLIQIILNVLIFLGYFDINLLYSNGHEGIAYIFVFYLVIVVLMFFYVYPLISRYYLKMRDLFRIAFQILVRKPYIGIIGLAIAFVYVMLMTLPIVWIVVSLFGASLLCYITMLMSNSIIASLEESIKKLYEK